MRNDPHVSISVLWPTLRWTSVQESARLAQTWSANSLLPAHHHQPPDSNCLPSDTATGHCQLQKCWAAFIAILRHVWSTGHRWHTPGSLQIWEQCIPQLQYEQSIARCDQWPAHWPEEDSLTAERSIRELGRRLAVKTWGRKYGRKVLWLQHRGGGKRILQAQYLASLAGPASSGRVQEIRNKVENDSGSPDSLSGLHMHSCVRVHTPAHTESYWMNMWRWTKHEDMPSTVTQKQPSNWSWSPAKYLSCNWKIKDLLGHCRHSQFLLTLHWNKIHIRVHKS